MSRPTFPFFGLPLIQERRVFCLLVEKQTQNEDVHDMQVEAPIGVNLVFLHEEVCSITEVKVSQDDSNSGQDGSRGCEAQLASIFVCFVQCRSRLLIAVNEVKNQKLEHCRLFLS